MNFPREARKISDKFPSSILEVLIKKLKKKSLDIIKNANKNMIDKAINPELCLKIAENSFLRYFENRIKINEKIKLIIKPIKEPLAPD